MYENENIEEQVVAKLELLKSTKAEIKNALNEKNAGIKDVDPFSTYPAKIANMNLVDNQDPITVNPTTSNQVVTPTQGKTGLSQVTVNAVTSSIDQNIVAENIKEGTTILGVQGSYSGLDTSDANATASDILKDKTAYVNGQKLTGTLEQSGGTGDVKLFETVEEMQADPNPQEGDLAVVYSNQQSNITKDSVFSKITLPETVVLDTAIEDYFEIGFQPVDESVEMDCFGNLDSNRMNVDIYMMSEETNYRITYESQDGITYTRSNDTPEEIDFGFNIKFGSKCGEVNWDDRIGQFFIIGQSNFNGLFEYSYYKDEDKIYLLDPTEIILESNDYVHNKSYKSQGIEIEKIKRIIDNCEIKTFDGNNRFNLIEISNKLYICKLSNSTSAQYIFIKDDSNKRIYLDDKNKFTSIYEVDLKNETTTEIDTSSITYQEVSFVAPSQTWTSQDYGITKMITFEYEEGNIIPKMQVIIMYVDLRYDENYFYYHRNLKNYDGFYYSYCYGIAKSQLNAKIEDLMPNKIAYSNKGVIIGTNEIYDKMDILKLKQKLFGGEIVNNVDGFMGTKFLKIPHLPIIYSNVKDQDFVYIKKCENNEKGDYILSELNSVIDIHDFPLPTIDYDSNSDMWINNYLQVYILCYYDNEIGRRKVAILSLNKELIEEMTIENSDKYSSIIPIYNYEYILFYDNNNNRYVYNENGFNKINSVDFTNSYYMSSDIILADRYYFYVKYINLGVYNYQRKFQINIYLIDLKTNQSITVAENLNASVRSGFEISLPKCCICNLEDKFYILFPYLDSETSTKKNYVIEINKLTMSIDISTSNFTSGKVINDIGYDNFCFEDENYIYLLTAKAKIPKNDITNFTRISGIIKCKDEEITIEGAVNNDLYNSNIRNIYYLKDYEYYYKLSSIDNVDYNFNDDTYVWNNCEFASSWDLESYHIINDELTGDLLHGLYTKEEVYSNYYKYSYHIPGLILTNYNNWIKFIFDKPENYKISNNDYDYLVTNNCGDSAYKYTFALKSQMKGGI